MRAQEVLVADVATAEDGQSVVGNEHLVVHSMVDAAQLVERREKLRRAGASQSHERIDEANLYAFEGCQVRKQPFRGVDMQVVSTNVAFYKYDQDAATTVAIAQACNNEVRQMTMDYPTRFAGLATLPMQDIPAAIAELERAVV